MLLFQPTCPNLHVGPPLVCAISHRVLEAPISLLILRPHGLGTFKSATGSRELHGELPPFNLRRVVMNGLTHLPQSTKTAVNPTDATTTFQFERDTTREW